MFLFILSNENQHKNHNYQPAFPISKIWQYSKELTQLDKLLKSKNKFGGIVHNFIFKLNIFNDKYQIVDLLPNLYPKDTFVMLIGQAQPHFYTNYEFIILFDNFCRMI